MSGLFACPRLSRARTGANVADVAPSARAHVNALTGASRASHGHPLTGSRPRTLSPLGRGSTKPVQGRTARGWVPIPTRALKPPATVTGAPRGIPSCGARAWRATVCPVRHGSARFGTVRHGLPRCPKCPVRERELEGQSKTTTVKGLTNPFFFFTVKHVANPSGGAHAPAASSPDDKPHTGSADCSAHSNHRPGPQ